MSFDLTNKNIEETFQNLLQKTGSDNRLYDLTGNEVTDLRINGTLTADQYIVSSSVTNITTQQLSGSTQFGDTSDDTHQFTGNITASGNISSSGTYTGDGGGLTNIPASGIVGLNLSRIASGSLTASIAPGKGFEINTNITSSGNISASGAIKGGSLDINGNADFGEGNITNVSNINLDSISADANTNTSISVNSADITVEIDGNAVLELIPTKVTVGDTAALGLFVDTHITASGNINSSGTLTANGGIFTGNVSFDDKNITNVGLIDVDTIRADAASNVSITLGSGGLNFNVEDGDKFTFNNGETNADFQYMDATDTELLHMDAGLSRVGIGDISPVSKLDVAGDLNVQSNITASGDISASGALKGSSLDINGNADFGDGNITNVGDIQVDSITDDATGDTSITLSGTEIAVDVGGSSNQSLTATKYEVEVPTHIKSHITASGNISASGDIFANSGSFNYITASKIDVDASTIRIGGEELSKANLQTLRQGKTLKTVGAAFINPDMVAQDGKFTGNITASGVISSSGGFVGDGSGITGLTSAAISVYNSNGNDRIITSVNSSTVQGESNLTFNSNNQLTVGGDITASGNISASGDIFKTKFVQMTNSSSAIDTFNTGSFRSAKYVLQVTSASNYQVSEMLVLHNDGTTLNTEYAQLNSGLNLVDFTTDVNNSNVRLNAAGSSISCSVKYERTIIPT